MKDITGLSSKKAQELLKTEGYNEIIRKKNKNKFEILIDVLKDPILIIMIFAMVISILSGHSHSSYSEAIVIGALIIVNVLISFIQEVKTLEKLEALNAINEDRSIVIRDGKEIEIPSKNIVKGDVVKIGLGTIARADIKIIKGKDIKVDEAFLTGESDEISKEFEDIIYSNSPITNGQGFGLVINTGMNTKIGEIASQVDEVEKVKSQLEIKILDISKILLIIAVITSIIIATLTYLNTQDISQTLSITISILIATVPEGLATVLAIVLTFMSQKMATNNALVKKVALLETLGEVDFVCSDKTGTITENKMKVEQVKEFDDSELTRNIQKTIIDKLTPTSRAINLYLENVEVKDLSIKVLDNIPFNSTIKKTVFLLENENQKYLVSMGAPDFLCEDVNINLPQVKELAQLGLRTILINYKETDLNDLKGYDLANIEGFKNIVLYGIQDPPKKSAIEAIQTMKKASIATVMITGDNIDTAKSIATQAGIFTKGDLYLTGEELSKIGDEEFLEIVEKVKVYARVKPEDKYRIVSALQSKNKIVAMTGDGTNDSIALKKANVGVAMGNQGTDIAKESADLILLDDNFFTITKAIEGGRLIFDNLKKFIRQMLTSNTAHVGGILFALLAGLTTSSSIVLPMSAVLILWVNVVSDAIPCLALGLDNAEKNIMDKPPIDPNMKLLDSKMLIEILIRGLSIGLLVFLTFSYVFYDLGESVEYARTVAFIVLSFGQLIHIFDARSFNTIYLKNPFENKLVWYAVFLSGTLNLLIVYTPLNQVFGIEAIPLNVLIISILISSIPTFGLSLIKLMYLKITKFDKKDKKVYN